MKATDLPRRKGGSMRRAISTWLILGMLSSGGAGLAYAGSVSRGSKAPEISAGGWLNHEGGVSLESMRGMIVVVEFWATWCGPCVSSIPHLNDLHKQWRSKGVAIVALTDESFAKVQAFAKKKPMHYIVGTGSQSAGRYGVRGIPHAFIIDPNGRVAWEGHPQDGLDQAILRVHQKTPPNTLSKKDRLALEQILANARQARKAGTSGRAYRLASRVTQGTPEWDDLYDAAAELKQELEAEAEEQLSKTRSLLDAKKYADAVPILSRVSANYPDSEVGKKASDTLGQLDKSPAVRAAIRKAKKAALAKKKYGEAEKALRAENYLEAHKKFEFIIKKCRGTEYAERARKRIDEMQSNAQMASKLKEQRTKKDCRGWLSMARNYAKTGSKDKAKTYYSRVLKTYPNTEYAKTAKAELNRL